MRPTTPTLKNRTGMHVSLADIITTYLALFGERQAPDMPFADAAKAIQHAKPATWHLLFDAALAARRAAPEASYETLAADPKLAALCGPDA